MLIFRRQNGLATTTQPFTPFDTWGDHLSSITLFKYLVILYAHGLYRTKLINVFNKCGKKVKASMP